MLCKGSSFDFYTEHVNRIECVVGLLLVPYATVFFVEWKSQNDWKIQVCKINFMFVWFLEELITHLVCVCICFHKRNLETATLCRHFYFCWSVHFVFTCQCINTYGQSIENNILNPKHMRNIFSHIIHWVSKYIIAIQEEKKTRMNWNQTWIFEYKYVRVYWR